MQLQTQRTNKSGPSWVNLSIGLVLMMNSSCLGQYASLYGNQQAYGYNLNQYELTYAQQQQQQQQQLQQQQQQQQQQQLQQQQYEAAAQSIWSGAPIVVSDNANNYLEQQYQTPTDASSLSAARRQYSVWGVDPRAAPPPRPIPIPTRAANHNYDNVSGHVPGYFYQPVPRPTAIATPTPTEATTSSTHQSELVPSEARRHLEQQQEDEEQIVHIGGSRSLATNYNNYNRNFIQPQQQRPQALSQQEHIAKYLQHYANYVRKYPQRLQPIYNDDK